jgi:hypothetical protein
VPAQDLGPQWLRIEDFSPGCYSNAVIATGNNGHGQLAAPIGSADAENTWSCCSNPAKSLVALPELTQVYNWPTDYNPSGNTYVVGLLVHDELADGTTEAVIMSQYWNGSTTSYWQACSYILESASTHSVASVTYSDTAGGIFGSPYPAMTRTSATVSGGFAQPPLLPTIVFPGPSTTPNLGSMWLYPNPATPTSYAALNIISTSTVITGQMVTHNNRIMAFAGTGYQWPTGGGFSTNENIFYTDPFGSTVWPAAGTAPTVLATESPYGYGAAGSISNGELFVVKKRGGGLIMTGDISSPTVTILPGVASTGNFYGNGASTTAGFIYCSYDAGCWSWNGSNTSQKISQQLDDSFFLPPEFHTMLSNNYGFYVNSYRSRIYVSNNWLMDTNTGAWWTYYPRKAQGGYDLFYTQVVNGDYIYAARLSFNQTNRDFMFKFDNTVPANIYQWQSLPLHLAPVNQVVDVRQVIVRASSTNPDIIIKVAIIDQGEVVAESAMSGSLGTGPELIRFNFGAISCYEPAIRITVDGTAPATHVTQMPVIHGIDMQYNISNHLPSTN